MNHHARPMSLTTTQDHVSSDELNRGLRRLMADAAFATIVGTLNSGVVLVAYAYFSVRPRR